MPSTTETLFELGASSRVVGVTRFCIRPAEAQQRADIVGGTKNPRIDRIRALGPDLVFANVEENREEDVARLRDICPVYVAFPKDVSSAIEEIRIAGELVGAERRAAQVANEIEECRNRESSLDTKERFPLRFRFLYIVWRRPYLAAGTPTFIDALLSEVGGTNVAPEDRGRYPEVSVNDIANARPDVIFLSSEPFPFSSDHVSELSEELDDSRYHQRIWLVDGELLSWHGARLREGLPYAHSLAARARARSCDRAT